MVDNDIQWVGLRCRSKQGPPWRCMGSRVGLMVSAGACRENRQI